ncbi:MAG: TerB family tellurite resistance protein [Fidelibacterota bacterium]
MLSKIKTFFDAHMVTGEERAVEAGGQSPVPVAVCALLLEMAHADGEFSPEEMDKIIVVMEEEFGLSPGEAKEVMALAGEEREQSIDLWQFTHLISRHCDREEKLTILETLWSVIYSDGVLEAHEDYLVHKLANVLELSHRELIDTKLRVLES